MFLKEIIFYFLVFVYNFHFAEAQVCSSKNILNESSKEILNCIEPECFSVADIDKDNKPELIIRQNLEKISEEEAVVRLIYAEMLASSCSSSLSNEELGQMALGIASVISKRFSSAQKKNKNVSLKDIVFQPMQFRSSLGSCDVSKRAEFLCPSKEKENEIRVWKEARNAWGKLKFQDPLKAKAQHYFFYKHFNNSQNCHRFKGVVPTWANDSAEVKFPLMTKELSLCVRFFK